jgi:hypothetical protein
VKRDLLAVPVSDARILARVDALLSELRAFRALYLDSVGIDADDAKLAELLREIQTWTKGDYAFSVSEVIAHARLTTATNLRAAIVSVIGELNKEAGKRLGQLLRRNAGRNVNGLRIHREGSDGAGAIWAITSCAE